MIGNNVEIQRKLPYEADAGTEDELEIQVKTNVGFDVEGGFEMEIDFTVEIEG